MEHNPAVGLERAGSRSALSELDTAATRRTICGRYVRGSGPKAQTRREPDEASFEHVVRLSQSHGGVLNLAGQGCSYTAIE